MGFDLEKHLQNHAMFFKKYSKFQEDNLHFTFSYLDLQFIDRDISTIMSNLLRDLREATSYKVANGKREDKHGCKKRSKSDTDADSVRTVVPF